MVPDIPSESEEAPEKISWRVHPLMENLGRSVLLGAIIFATCAGVWIWTSWPGMVLLALLFLVVSMAPFIFPTRYRVDRRGIEIVFLGVRTFRAWDQFRNFYPHEMGVHLSTFRRPSGLDPFRGSFIRFTPENREAVLRFLEKHITREEAEKEKVRVKTDD